MVSRRTIQLFAAYLLTYVAWRAGLVSCRAKVTLLYGSDMTQTVEELPISQICKEEESAAKLCVGGWSRVVYKTDELRKRENHSVVLFLDLGNNMHKSVAFMMHGVNVTIEFLRLLKADVMAINNRDLYLSPDQHADFIRALNVPCVLTNAEFAAGTPLHDLVNRSAMIERDGVRIAIMSFLASGVDLRDDVKLLDPVTAMKTECRKLSALNVALVVAAGVGSVEQMRSVATKAYCVDVLISGDASYFLYSGKAEPLFHRVGNYPDVLVKQDDAVLLIAGSCVYTYYLGYLSVEMNEFGDVVSWSGGPVLLDADVPMDAKMSSLLDTTYMPMVRDLFSRENVVGATRGFIDGRWCMARECSFGNMVTDAMVAYGLERNLTASQLALMSGGEVCRTIDGNRLEYGYITKGDIINSLVYGSQLHTVSFTGRQLALLMEQALDATDAAGGENAAFLQVSGLRVVYSAHRPRHNRVVYLEVMTTAINGVPCYGIVDPSAVYDVAVSDAFLSTAGRYMAVLKTAPVRHWKEMQMKAITWYVNHTSPVYPAVEGRIVQAQPYSGDGARFVATGVAWALLTVLFL